MSAAHYLQYEMPDEVLLTIFSYLLEQDLCRVALVCKRFQVIANDCELWKRLYQSVYEYDLPLFNPEHGVMNFVKVEECEFSNPWKESFRQLYQGIHVRPGYQDKKYEGRSISYFNTIQAALDFADEKNIANNSNINNAGMSVASVANSNLSLPSTPPNVNEENESVHETSSTLIFLHTGIYRGEFLVIDSDITLIGAAPGNVAESIVLGECSLLI
jgi:F-box protein 11